MKPSAYRDAEIDKLESHIDAMRELIDEKGEELADLKQALWEREEDLAKLKS